MPADWIPPADPSPHPPDALEDMANAVLPDLQTIARWSRETIGDLREAREDYDRRVREHADAVVAYRKAKFAKAIEARTVEVEGRKLTERERQAWTDAELVDLKHAELLAAGMLRSAQMAFTYRDRRNAAVGRYADAAQRELRRHG